MSLLKLKQVLISALPKEFNLKIIAKINNNEPDPILRKKSDLIERVDDELRKLMDDMLQLCTAWELV